MPSCSTLDEGRVDVVVLELSEVELPVVEEGGMPAQNATKARNHLRVASALPHSEGIVYKPPCGEIAMCLRVGRMGPIK